MAALLLCKLETPGISPIHTNVDTVTFNQVPFGSANAIHPIRKFWQERVGTSELTRRSGEVSEGCLLNGPNSPHNVLLSVVRVKRKVTIGIICKKDNSSVMLKLILGYNMRSHNTAPSDHTHTCMHAHTHAHTHACTCTRTCTHKSTIGPFCIRILAAQRHV